MPVRRPTLLAVDVGAEDHVLGSRDAPVTLVQYADFECPFCGRAFPELKSVLHDLGKRVRFVFRHFPVIEAHPHAEAAAEVAEAAGAQGKFWEMHDLLFRRQAALDDDHLLAYVRELGLDAARVERELAARAPRASAGGHSKRSPKRSERHTDVLHQRSAPRGAGRRPDVASGAPPSNLVG